MKTLVICTEADDKHVTLRLPTRTDAFECPLCLRRVGILSHDHRHQVLIGSW
jgi:hypothetical protein